MPRFSVTKSLESSLDPLLLVSGDGTVVWHNAALDAVKLELPRGWRISDWLTDTSARKILSTTVPQSIRVSFRESPSRNIEMATVVDVGGGGPGQELFLVALTPLASSLSDWSSDVSEHFLVTMAHDLKNPLGAIFGYTDALLDSSVGEGLTDQQRDIISRVRGTATRCLELVRNAQHIAHLELRGDRGVPDIYDINISVKAVFEYTWRDERTCPSLFMHLAKEPLWARVVRSEFERAVVNLLTNAIKFTPPEGTITVRTRHEGSEVVVEVHNTSPYIPAAELPTIFSKYVRGSTSSGTAGSGLGLYIIKLVAEAAGGTVRVSSSEVAGTTFQIRLPAMTEAQRG